MFHTVSQHLNQKFKLFFLTDNLIFNNKIIPLTQENFGEIIPLSNANSLNANSKTIAFIDGGQAEILSGGNLCLSFIRVFAQVMQGLQKISSQKHEFYLLTTAVFREGEVWYESKIFPLEGMALIDEKDLFISSYDPTLRLGTERAPIGKIASIARRFSELKLAWTVSADYVLMDGTLSAVYQHEEKYLASLHKNISALAKTCSLFTTCGNNPVVLLQKLSPHAGCWCYVVDEKMQFVKLHPQAKHVFRFEGNPGLLPFLVEQSTDALFLGYPYGLILADKMARVGNAERDALRMNFLLRTENSEIREYLNATNAHDILDRLG